jgi:hypothetical protein
MTTNQAASCSAAQKFPDISRNPKVHYRVHKNHPTGPYPQPNQCSPTTTFHVSNIHFNIILDLSINLRNDLFPFGFPAKILYAFRPPPGPATLPTHLILLYLIVLINLGQEYKLWSSSLVCCISEETGSSIATIFVATWRVRAGSIGEGRHLILLSGEGGWRAVSGSDIDLKIPIPDVRNTFILICRVPALLKLV